MIFFFFFLLIVLFRSIQKACQDGDAMQAHRIFEAARKDRSAVLDDSVFTNMFAACAVSGLGKLALKTLAKMRKLGYDLTVAQIECIIESIGRSKGRDNQMDQLEFVRKIVHSPKWQRKHCFGNDFLKAYGRLSDRFDTVESALRVMREMGASKRFDKTVYTKLISSYGEHHQSDQMTRLFVAVMNELKVIPDSRAFLAMMKGYASDPTQRYRVFELYDQIIEKGLPIDKYIVTLVLRTAFKARKFGKAVQIVDMLEMNPEKIDWDLALLNELMLVASHARDAPKLVQRIMSEMEGRNIPTDVNSYNLRIALHARLKQIDDAFALLPEMRQCHIECNEATFTALFTACRACGDAERAWALFQAMDAQHHPLDNAIHASILESVFQRNQRPDLMELWRARVREWRATHEPTAPSGPTPYAHTHGGGGEGTNHNVESGKMGHGQGAHVNKKTKSMIARQFVKKRNQIYRDKERHD